MNAANCIDDEVFHLKILMHVMGKPRGLRIARKHVKNRRAQVWADLE